MSRAWASLLRLGSSILGRSSGSIPDPPRPPPRARPLFAPRVSHVDTVKYSGARGDDPVQLSSQSFDKRDHRDLPASLQIYLGTPPPKLSPGEIPLPHRQPIPDLLPPLPMIHDWSLALSAVDCRTPQSARRRLKLALLGDHLLHPWAAYAVDQSGDASCASELVSLRMQLTSNRTFWHLAMIYDLRRIGPKNEFPGVTQIKPRPLADGFEAWIGASWLDARQRGSKAVRQWELALEWMFRKEVWMPTSRRSTETIYGDLAFPCSSLPRSLHRRPGPSTASDAWDSLDVRPERRVPSTSHDLDHTILGPAPFSSAVEDISMLEGHPPRTQARASKRPVAVYERRPVADFGRSLDRNPKSRPYISRPRPKPSVHPTPGQTTSTEQSATPTLPVEAPPVDARALATTISTLRSLGQPIPVAIMQALQQTGNRGESEIVDRAAPDQPPSEAQQALDSTHEAVDVDATLDHPASSTPTSSPDSHLPSMPSHLQMSIDDVARPDDLPAASSSAGPAVDADSTSDPKHNIPASIDRIADDVEVASATETLVQQQLDGNPAANVSVDLTSFLSSSDPQLDLRYLTSRSASRASKKALFDLAKAQERERRASLQALGSTKRKRLKLWRELPVLEKQRKAAEARTSRLAKMAASRAKKKTDKKAAVKSVLKTSTSADAAAVLSSVPGAGSSLSAPTKGRAKAMSVKKEKDPALAAATAALIRNALAKTLRKRPS